MDFPEEYTGPLLNVVAPLLVASLDLLISVAIFGGQVTVVFYFMVGWLIAGVAWVVEVWRFKARQADPPPR